MVVVLSLLRAGCITSEMYSRALELASGSRAWRNPLYLTAAEDEVKRVLS